MSTISIAYYIWFSVVLLGLMCGSQLTLGPKISYLCPPKPPRPMLISPTWLATMLPHFSHAIFVTSYGLLSPNPPFALVIPRPFHICFSFFCHKSALGRKLWHVAFFPFKIVGFFLYFWQEEWGTIGWRPHHHHVFHHCVQIVRGPWASWRLHLHLSTSSFSKIK